MDAHPWQGWFNLYNESDWLLGECMKRAAVWFMPLLLVVVATLLTLTYMTLTSKHDVFSAKIGEAQGAVIATQARAEKAMLYIDMSAQYAETEAGYKLAQSGGFYEQPCGDYMGFTLWNNRNMECWPERPEVAFEKYFNDGLSQRLSAYPDADLLNIRYAVFDNNHTLYGFALDPITYDILFISPDVRPEDLAFRNTETIKQSVAKEYPRPDKPTGRYTWPANSEVITSCYGYRNIDYGSTEHRGIDIRADVDDPVYAIADGRIKVSNDLYKTITIEHADGVTSMYLHNSRIIVKDKAEVKQGDPIALAGKSGAKFPHIHLTIKKNNAFIDPLDPSLSFFNLASLSRSKSSNCYYACSQYTYCENLKEMKTV
jgi:murein DD-endopeptidase MepM/ murein hydrolase activator NlpD